MSVSGISENLQELKKKMHIIFELPVLRTRVRDIFTAHCVRVVRNYGPAGR
jgi:hypothetical protein